MIADVDNLNGPSSGLTVGQFCEYIAPSVWSNAAILAWPPDVFALAAALLLKSGAYVHAVSGWQRQALMPQESKVSAEGAEIR